MKKLNVAIIGQGRSGKDIHGKYFRSDDNTHYTVKYVVDADEFRRDVARRSTPVVRPSPATRSCSPWRISTWWSTPPPATFYFSRTF